MNVLFRETVSSSCRLSVREVCPGKSPGVKVVLEVVLDYGAPPAEKVVGRSTSS